MAEVVSRGIDAGRSAPGGEVHPAKHDSHCKKNEGKQYRQNTCRQVERKETHPHFSQSVQACGGLLHDSQSSGWLPVISLAGAFPLSHPLTTRPHHTHPSGQAGPGRDSCHPAQPDFSSTCKGPGQGQGSVTFPGSTTVGKDLRCKCPLLLLMLHAGDRSRCS